MSLKNSENFFDTIKPIYYISRAMGLFPFTVEKSNNKLIVKTTFFDVLTILIQIIFVSYIIAMNISQNVFEEQSNSDISNVGMHAIMTFTLIVSIFLILINFAFKGTISKIIVRMTTIDNSLNASNVEVNHKKIIRATYIFLIIVGMIFISFYIPTIYLLIFESKVNAGFIFISNLLEICFIYTAFLLVYIALVNSVWMRFLYINKNLKKSIPRNSNEINKIARVHDQLNDVIELINFHFACWMMLSFGICLGFTILNIYSTIRIIFNYEYYGFILATVYLLITFYFLIITLIVLTISSNTTREVRNIFNFL